MKTKCRGPHESPGASTATPLPGVRYSLAFVATICYIGMREYGFLEGGTPMRRANRAVCLTACVFLLTDMSAGTAGEVTRLPFSYECRHRTPAVQNTSNQSRTGETVGAGRSFGVFINATLYGQIKESIDTYIADLESDGWQVVVYAAEGGTSGKSDSAQWTTEDFLCELEAARQLRDLLKNERNQGMVGCMLIGELPAGWVEDPPGSGTGSPIDLFFRDMDGQWEDYNNNGLLDEILLTEADCDCKPEICTLEIWMSRLYANSLDGDEVTLMKNYFRKNHAYRIGELTLPRRALDYVDDTWANWGFSVGRIYDDITQVNDNQISIASDYIERLTEGYELIRVLVHGTGPEHVFYNTPDFATAYAHTYVHSPVAQAVQLRLGADDSIKAWLNGISIPESCRGSIEAEDTVQVSLKEGWNALLLKTGDQWKLWRFTARFTNNQGSDVENLSYQLNDPETHVQEAPFIQSWLINGFYYDPNTPWCNRLDNDHLGGESDANAVEGQIDGDYVWERISRDSASGYINLNDIFQDHHNLELGVAYSFVNVYSEEDQGIQLWLGCNSGIKAWLNGEHVFTYDSSAEGWIADEHKVDVTLRKGYNRLLLKIRKSYVSWGFGFSARFVHPDGMAVEGLEYDPAPVPVRYIKSWLINGWYKNEDKETCLSTTDYLDGEDSVLPSDGETDGSFVWQTYHSLSNDIDLNRLFSKPGGVVDYKDVLAVDPCCFFYDSFSCVTFNWWVPNYIDGWYVFSPSYGLASWGESWPDKAGTFYSSLFKGKCLGEAQLIYLSQHISVDFGMFGDPTLVPGRPRVWSLAFVDTNAVGDNNGSTWEDAYNYLQDALEAATWGTEIHVAQGTYWPDQGDAISPGDRNAAFRLKKGVAIKGGYAGLGELDSNARNIVIHPTILSGDIGIPNANVDNAYHVVTANSVDAAAMLDGLTITWGNADGTDANNCGGGVYIDQAHPRLINCSIISNVAAHRGGGIYNKGGNLLLARCTFNDNYSSAGGGIYNHHASPLLWHTKFDSNSAISGGGIYNFTYGEPMLSFCEFHQNSATEGGGMFNGTAPPILTNCIFSLNQAKWYGGGIYEAASTTRLINCTFSSNSARYGGGAVYNFQGSQPELAHCILWGDTPDEICVDSGEPLACFSDIEGGWPVGAGNINIDPEFTDPNNGDYHLKSQAGRWNPIDEIWAMDKVDSPCIDTGDPLSPVGDEPEPNGGIINMGAYGGTAEASKSSGQ
jgi:hypothetical protein